MPGALTRLDCRFGSMISVRYAADGWGVGELWLDGATLVHHELPRPGLEPDLVAQSHKVPLGDRLAAYFAGAREEFGDVELELEGGTPFQLAVTAALRAIPYRETVTY